MQKSEREHKSIEYCTTDSGWRHARGVTAGEVLSFDIDTQYSDEPPFIEDLCGQVFQIWMVNLPIINYSKDSTRRWCLQATSLHIM